jgi:hypothetical protein
VRKFVKDLQVGEWIKHGSIWVHVNDIRSTSVHVSKVPFSIAGFVVSFFTAYTDHPDCLTECEVKDPL